MKIRTQGYRIKNYDAGYEQTNFLFEEQIVDSNQRNIKVTDLDSGMEFWLPVPLKVETPSQKRKRN